MLCLRGYYNCTVQYFKDVATAAVLGSYLKAMLQGYIL
jgi:hypothetical protein